MVRVNPDGSLDSTFRTNGFATLIAGTGGIEFQPNGQIVLGASRYNANGSLDTGFGHQGVAITDFSNVAPFTSPSDLAIEPNGAIIVAGQAALPKNRISTVFSKTAP